MKVNCQILGCDSDSYIRGWCVKHYGRWKRHGDPEFIKSTRTRQVPSVPVGTCVVCDGPIYAQMGRNRKHCSQVCQFVTHKELFVAQLTENSNLGSPDARRRCYRFGLLEPVCSVCGLAEWRGRVGEDAPLQLDHINGNGTDYRIENLRIICANCHMQTDTYAGRNIGNTTRKKYARLSSK